MYGVEFYAAVRLAVVEEGLSHHEAGRRFGIDRRTVKKMPRYSAPPGYRRTKPVRRPKLDRFTGIVDAILEAVHVLHRDGLVTDRTKVPDTVSEEDLV